jgi:transglutaminase superfamily protein
MSYVLPETTARVPLASRLVITFAVLAARALSRRSPASLRRLLGTVTTGARPATYDEARFARDQVLTVSPRCRGRSACLIRSVAVVLLCRSRGIRPTWCVGVVATPPFTAHAWIEADGRMVDEPIDSSCYQVFFTVPGPQA